MEKIFFKGFFGLSLALLMLLVGVYFFRSIEAGEAAAKNKIYVGAAELNFSDSQGVIREYIPEPKEEEAGQDELLAASSSETESGDKEDEDQEVEASVSS